MKILPVIWFLGIMICTAQNDTVKVVKLEEVKISLHERKEEKIKFLPSTNFVGSMLLMQGQEIVSCIYPTEKLKGKRLVSVSIKMKKELFPPEYIKKRIKKLKKEYEALLRIRIYSREGDKPVEIFVSDTIGLRYPHDRIISLDLSGEDFYFNEEGFCVGVEFLGYRSLIDHTIIKAYDIMVSLTGKQSPLYRQETFIRKSAQTPLELLQHYFEKISVDEEFRRRNLSIAFTYR